MELDSPRMCPECHEPLIELGRFFEPPKQNNIRQRRKVEAIVQAGFKFTSNGEQTPETLGQVQAYSDVMRRRRQSEGQRLALKFNKHTK